MQVVAFNPMAEQRSDEKFEAEPAGGFFQRHKKVFKTLGALGVLAVAGVAGYIAGSSGSSGSGSDTSSTTGGVSEIEAAMTTVQQGFNDPENLALTDQMDFDMLNSLLDEYESNPTGWVDQYLTTDIMEALRRLRNSDAESLSGGRLLREDRELIGNYNEQLVDLAFEHVEAADYTLPGVVKEADDHVLIYRSSGYCFIIAQESNSDEDWDNNWKTGTVDILPMSSSTQEIQDESCGCKTTRGWWCAEYNTCVVSSGQPIGKGYRGFTEAYNAMRTRIFAKMQSTCSSNDIRLFTGFSRGASIVTLVSYAALVEGLIPANRMKLVTFGSPRTLEKKSSDIYHNRFEQWRLIFRKDPVPAVPFGWMGFRHVGEMRCHECGYAEERDRPGWGSLNEKEDHTSYCTYFGDARCE